MLCLIARSPYTLQLVRSIALVNVRLCEISTKIHEWFPGDELEAHSVYRSVLIDLHKEEISI